MTHMQWKQALKALVQSASTEMFPLRTYKAYPPSGECWPSDLPRADVLKEFYSICDGGYIDEYRWARLSELSSLNKRWRDNLHNYYPDGTSPLRSDRHIVMGTDSAGAPLIWDSIEDRVFTFWFKGGDWEPTGYSLSDFLDQLFTIQPGSDELWSQALAQLYESYGAA